MELPKQFEEAMSQWLGNEWAAFRESLQSSSSRAVRLHRIAVASHPNPTSSSSPLALQNQPQPAPHGIAASLRSSVPWSEDGYFISATSRLGKSIYHETGAFYLQEASAMAAVTALAPKPMETVLDLCAAPGGKSSGIAKRMRGLGTLVVNEIHPSRVRTLAQNMERLGIPAVITNESPGNLAEAVPAYFDAVLVDAPCSGEGMFRKDPESVHQWYPDAPEDCAVRQRDILTQAVQLTKPGGRIVYSTCTFNPVENERIISWAVQNLPVQIRELPLWDGWSTGRPEWADGNSSLVHTRRMWPHIGHGEGHFVALLDVTGAAVETDAKKLSSDPSAKERQMSAAQLKDWHSFLAQLVVKDCPAEWMHPLVQGDIVFARSAPMMLPRKLKVLRPGLALAAMENGRLTPHHSLAMALYADAASQSSALSPEEASSFLAGESMPPIDTKGWTWMHVHGMPLGWGKSVSGRVNNSYPKGLRKSGLIWHLLDE